MAGVGLVPFAKQVVGADVKLCSVQRSEVRGQGSARDEEETAI